MDYDEMPEREPDAQPGEVTVSATKVQYEARAMFDAIARTAAHTIVEQIKRDLVADVRSAVQQQIQAQVSEIVAATLDGKLQPTNEWGEPKGEPVAMRDMVAKAGREYLNVKVNKEGVVTSYNADKTRLEFLVSKQVQEVFSYAMQKEVTAAVELARKEAVAKVGSLVGDLIIKIGSK